MTGQEAPTGADGGASAQRAADRLALALEDVGFDVGQAFPMLHSGTNRNGAPLVELGSVTEGVASDLATVLLEAARLGVTL
jgi:hypothetical protein